MIGFCLPSDFGHHRDPLPLTQPVLLACAVLFLELAVATQSRGALWTFFLVDSSSWIPSLIALRHSPTWGGRDPLGIFWGR